MELTTKLKKRFVKNYNLPIKIFSEPYFSSRIELYNTLFFTKSNLNEFINDINKYSNEEEYFAEDNKFMQTIIDYIRNKDGYISFNNMDMKIFEPRYKFSSSDIWKENNIDKVVFSIDLKKANFQALKYFDSSIFNNEKYWECFIEEFTEERSKISSKHLRQVIFGTLNPKRQTQYERYLMEKILTSLFEISPHWDKNILSLSNDEIVIDVTPIMSWNGKMSMDYPFLIEVRNKLETICDQLNLNCHIDCFQIKSIGKYMYKKDFLLSSSSADCFKKVNHLMMPFVIRKELGLYPEPEDYVFFNEGHLCKFLENPLLGGDIND